MRIKLTKLKDERFDGQHPNRINEGYTKEGEMQQSPVVGEAFYLESFNTSTVTELLPGDMFRTLNSVYKIEYL
jgi:hypothetical protein